MSYTKTTWNDLTAPAIDATNLNKIEQGIYDNSIDITSINTLIGSSGTATATQTDFTQGQLTQKLGLKYIKMKGQTSQASDPTPTNPVNVNNVSGSNVLKVCNKNLCPTGNKFAGVTNQWCNQYGEELGTVQAIQSNSNYIMLKPNTTYKFHIHEYNNISTIQIVYLDNTNNLMTYANYSVSTNVATFTTTSYTKVYIRAKATTNAGNTYFIGQLEEGTATTYVEHKEEDYNIDLPVENLAISNKGFPYTDRNVTYDYDNEKYILSGVSNNNNIYMMIYTPTETPLFKSGDVLTIMNETNWEDTSRVELLNSNSGTISGLIVSKNTTTTLTLSADVYGYRCWYNATNIKTFNGIYQKVQIERGTKIHAYTPYGVTPIELCKISTYQDYIYKNNGKWYLHKEIGSYTFTGNETFTSQSYGTNSWLVNSIINTISNDNLKLCISNIFTGISKDERNNEVSNSIYANTTTALYIRNTSFTSQSQIQSATNGNSVYYILATPTEEEITYEPLLRQLDKIDKIGLYDISNISQDNSDKKMLLDFTICNDNYNGLREFIRA